MMLKRFSRTMLGSRIFRMLAATTLIIAGFAPVGVPILSDASWGRATIQPEVAREATSSPSFTYRSNQVKDGSTRIERSDDGGQSWHGVAGISAEIQDLQPVPGDERTVVAVGDRVLWVSRDAGASWARRAELPSRALALAVTDKADGLVLVGTESLGLLRSRDLGEGWQNAGDRVLSAGGAAMAVTALAATTGEDPVIFAAAAIWLGTSRARLTPMGVFASVDGARSWLPLERAALGATVVTRLQPAAGKGLAVHAEDASGVRLITPRATSELLQLLEAPDAQMRAGAARYAGLIGDTAALPALLAHLSDPDPWAGDRAAEAVGLLGEQQAIPELLTALESAEVLVRARAARALGMLRAQQATSLLASMLRGDEPPAVREAANALAAIGTPEAVGALVDALDGDAMTAAAHAARSAIQQAGTEAVAPLAKALTDSDAGLRRGAAEMLGWLRASDVSGELAQALFDPDPAVAAEAAWALGELGTDEARAALAAAQEGPQVPQVRQAVEAAQSKIAAAQSEQGTAAGLLLDVLSTVPASRWSFLALALLAAVALLILGPRAAHLPPAR